MKKKIIKSHQKIIVIPFFFLFPLFLFSLLCSSDVSVIAFVQCLSIVNYKKQHYGNDSLIYSKYLLNRSLWLVENFKILNPGF